MKKIKPQIPDPDYFIIGLQKSGTYWLSALLDAHTEIRCLPNHEKHNASKGKTGADEGRIFDMLASVDEDGGKILRNSFMNHHGGFFSEIATKIEILDKEELYKTVKERYKEWFAFHNQQEKPIVGDKTTEYVFHLNMIDSFYPSSKKIAIIRDPKDRVVSWYYHQVRKGRINEGSAITDPFVKEYILNQVRKEYKHMLAYNGQIHCLTYESLSTDPHKTLRSLLQFLGAHSGKEEIQNMIDSASLNSLRKKDDNHKQNDKDSELGNPFKSHYRKGAVGEGKKKLTKHQMDMIESEIGHLQEKVLNKFKTDQ